MSRDAWTTTKNSKRFYVHTYRKAGNVLLASVIVNLLLIMTVHYLYFNQPGHDFYATSGVTAPIQLVPMDEPNYTSVPLLATSEANGNDMKVVPE